MRVVTVIVLIFIVTLSACTQKPFKEASSRPTAWSVTIDPNVSEEEEDDFRAGANEWEQRLLGLCPVEFYYRRGPVDDEVPDQSHHLTVKIDASISYNGWAEWYTFEGATSARILLRPKSMLQDYPDHYAEVIEHELGHAFGLLHGGNGIMIDDDERHEITENDADRVAAIQCP